MESLCSIHPREILIAYGPKKLLVDQYHWHSPNKGIVASYTPKDYDVEDHFGIFRGVDQIESFVQATAASLSMFLICQKNACAPEDLKEKSVPSFISVGNVNFMGALEKGDTYVMLGKITFYKFKQMVCDGRIYQCPPGLDLDDYFKDFNEERLFKYDLSPDFKLISDLYDITGREIEIEYFRAAKKK
ncbi:MAG: hypothetical protein FJY21_01675 [Bacteroidetes bacterium]|nr:hypothetical protein [Bacteroidota bacterium]